MSQTQALARDNLMELVHQVNTLLEQGEPENISVDTYSGYSGYKPQAIMDAMNAVFGLGKWGFDEISSTIEATDKDGKPGLLVSQVRVWLAGVDFKPTAWGQARVTKGDIGDARKGSQTDAVKKGLSYFSIGNRAYHGLLEKHEQKRTQSTQSRQSQHTSQSAQPQSVAKQETQSATQSPRPVQQSNAQPQEQHAAAAKTNPDEARQARLRALILRAVACNEIDKSLDGEAKKAAFVKLAADVCQANITALGHITASRLDTIEAYLNSKVA